MVSTFIKNKIKIYSLYTIGTMHLLFIFHMHDVLLIIYPALLALYTIILTEVNIFQSSANHIIYAGLKLLVLKQLIILLFTQAYPKLSLQLIKQQLIKRISISEKPLLPSLVYLQLSNSNDKTSNN